MTYEETAKLLDGMLNYWPNLFRGNDPESPFCRGPGLRSVGNKAEISA